MKSPHWKETAELVGIFAILASLIVVALQLHQQEELLQIEIRNYIVSSSLELNASIAEHGTIWAKGNAGEPLDAAEHAAYEALLVGLNDWYFHTRLVLQQIAPDEEIQMFVLFAGFLAENPGAYETWNRREQRLVAHRASLDAVAPADDITTQWVDQVRSSVDAIRRDQANR